MEIESKITFLFAAFGVIAGAMAGYVSALQQSGWLGLLIAIIIFFIPYKVTPRILKIHPAEFPGGKWTYGYAIKKGFSSFFIMWLTLWILVYNVLLYVLL